MIFVVRLRSYIGDNFVMEIRCFTAEGEAIKIIGSFREHLNSGDNHAFYDTIHAPHIEISADGVSICWDRQELEANYLKDFINRAGNSWHHTDLSSTEMFYSSDNKVNVYLR